MPWYQSDADLEFSVFNIFKILIFGFFPWPFIIGPGRKNIRDTRAGIYTLKLPRELSSELCPRA